MGKVSGMAMALIVCLAGCAQAGSGPADPSDVGTESTDLGDTDDEALAPSGTYDEVEQTWAEEDTADGEGDTEEGAARESDQSVSDATAPQPVKKACPDLEETTCKVTVGCAWNTVEKCIDE